MHYVPACQLLANCADRLENLSQTLHRQKVGLDRDDHAI